MLRQIWSDDNYVYAATSSGLDIIEIEAELPYAYVEYDGGFTTVWANTDKVYIGTSLSGVKYINKACISGSVSSPYELNICLADYLSVPDIMSNQIRYIHGNNGYLAISTISGVDVKGPGQSAKVVVDQSGKVFTTSSGGVYYITGSGTNTKINVKNQTNVDWVEPDIIYETGSFLIREVEILDIFVTEHTSDTGVANTIFTATSSGVYIIDEELYTSNTYYTA
jgi:hypothetical protein